jgi:bifunctional DNase/RNase
MVEVFVARLVMDSSTNSYVVILQEKGGQRLLPIWIGHAEADSIVMQMKNVKRERPMTHDLCKLLIQGLGAGLRRVQITRVQKNTYFAELHLVRGEEVVLVDARPSDSIAIALRLDAPIFAPESLLTELGSDGETEADESGGGVPEAAEDAEEEQRRMSAQQLKEHLENLRPEDFGKFNT